MGFRTPHSEDTSILRNVSKSPRLWWKQSILIKGYMKIRLEELEIIFGFNTKTFMNAEENVLCPENEGVDKIRMGQHRFHTVKISDVL